ncbi:poly(A)-specific ribonuclease PARN isoform X2 [Manduca sexta]|uniref:Poly(A)-specific ribonuclease RNA-binding domain-containing protein n=1 Tax=Manduca sexta TaxID=7130 RepID=A0A922CR54_MANSE|nr:poly(A)-specific ribonuclease PARN isoform X2 [Manduca sexta]KAG6454788.1 hypothetical protein O3G_MSEX008869 [Manduca sexta]
MDFKEALPLISASIDKADFLVIDTEFTGLINGRDVSAFDTPEEYYYCLLKGAKDFLLIQYGLCAFYWDHNRKCYMNDTYNFYLFPRGKVGTEKMFLCQSSSLDFLGAQGFDFNKVFKEGISYMTEPVETRLRENLLEKQKTQAKEKDAITIPDEHKTFVEDVCNQVRQFIDDNKSDEMEIEKCNSFVRLLLFQEIRARFKDEVLIESKILENKTRVLKVIRIKSEDDTKNYNAQKNEREWEELEEAVGFSKVARMISQSGKLVVGHNMLLDILHTLNHFFQPLPLDYNSFKEFSNCMFPVLLDTKYMSSLPPFKDRVNSSVLQHLFSTLSSKPFSIPTVGSLEGRGYRRADDKHHEAGFDAYVTGLCFLAMHGHLSRMRGEEHARPSATSAVLKPFLSKLFLCKTAHQDSPYMNLAGADPTPSRDHVFHLTFPKEWQRNDINQLFSPFGPVTVQFVEDTSALVALSRREQAAGVLRALQARDGVALLPYSTYKRLIHQTSSRSDAASGDCKTVHPSEIKARQVLASNVSPPTPQSSPVPVRVPRERTRSVPSPAIATPPAPAHPPVLAPAPAHAPITCKRTSSGVFQTCSNRRRKNSDTADTDSHVSHKRPNTPNNGHQESSRTAKQEKVKGNKKIIEKFDSESKSHCVTAFKESDSWD